jgi:uncharacterized protein YukE
MTLNKYIMKNFGAMYEDDGVEGGGGGGTDKVIKNTATIADTEKLIDFAEGLRTRATTLEDNISDIITIVDNMPQEDAWDGQVYTQFKTKVHSYENPMKAYVALIREYAKTIDVIQKYSVDTLESKIRKYSGGSGK